MNVQSQAADAAQASKLKPGEFDTLPRLLPLQFEAGNTRIYYGFVPKEGKQVLICLTRSNNPRCAPDVPFVAPCTTFIENVVGRNEALAKSLKSGKTFRLVNGEKENVELLEEVRSVICEPVPVAVQDILPYHFNHRIYAVRWGILGDGTAIVLVRHRGQWEIPNDGLYQKILDDEDILRAEDKAIFPETAEALQQALEPYLTQLGLK